MYVVTPVHVYFSLYLLSVFKLRLDVTLADVDNHFTSSHLIINLG